MKNKVNRDQGKKCLENLIKGWKIKVTFQIRVAFSLRIRFIIILAIGRKKKKQNGSIFENFDFI